MDNLDGKIHVFLGWSGPKSFKLAGHLKWLLSRVIGVVEPFFSDHDIVSGDNWNDALKRALQRSKFAIICLTKENCEAPWIHYEAGYISRADESLVCTYLFDLTTSEVKGPLKQRQARATTEDDTRKMLRDINRIRGAGNDLLIEEDVLNDQFRVWWPEFEQRIELLRDEDEYGPARQVMNVLQQRREEGPPPPQPPQPPPAGGRDTERTRRQEGAFDLEVINPSGYARGGPVSVPWSEVYKAKRIPWDEVVVIDYAGRELPTQVDLASEDDPTRGTLFFTPEEKIPGLNEAQQGQSGLFRVGRKKPETDWDGGPSVEVVKRKYVKLVNRDLLEVRLELSPTPWSYDPKKNWYAGGASSVLVGGEEVLGAYTIESFDHEKRCMQVDALQLYTEGRREILSKDEQPNLIRQPYQLISRSSGPVRASATLASPAFEYFEFEDEESDVRRRNPSKAKLYREISLYRDESYLLEKVSVRRVPAKGPGGGDELKLLFEVRYFSFFNFDAVVTQSAGWLTINGDWPLFQTYGFAASVPRYAHENPHRAFPKNGNEQKTYSWKLSSDREMTCLHLFTRGERKPGERREEQVERAWLEVIREPLAGRWLRHAREGKRAQGT